jgi:hypothetical protein
MPSRRHIALVLLALLGAAAPSAAQTQPAPVYELPPDGSRVDYTWTAFDAGGEKTAGTFRISSVGSTRVKGEAHRWLEIRKEVNDGDRTRVQFRKFLLAEKALAKGGAFADGVVAVYDRSGMDGHVTKLPPARARDFLALGLHGDGVALKAVAERERVETKLGAFVSRHSAARGESGGQTLEYHVWLTSEVPFGWAKIEVKEVKEGAAPRTVFTAAAVKKGEGATSEVDESRAR